MVHTRCLFQSGFHRFAFFFALAAVVVWFYAFKEWWGWLAALLLCIPAGVLTFMVPAMLLGTLRQVFGDALVTWASILAGVAVMVYALVALDSVTRIVVALVGASLVWSGVSLLSLRMNAMRHRAAIGELSGDEMQFLDEIDSRLR